MADGGEEVTMRRLTVGALLAALPVAFAATPASAVETPDQLFKEALAATGDDYLAIRDRLVAGREPVRVFLVKMKASETWQERLLAEILLERMAHGEQIRAVIDAGIEFAAYRGRSERRASASKALAEHFKAFPMVLVEFLWRGNELEDVFWGKELAQLRKTGTVFFEPTAVGEKAMYVAGALGLLGEKRASPVLLEVMLHEQEDDHARSQAGRALGELGATEHLGELLRIVEQPPDRTAQVAAWHAVRGCADRASIPMLREAAAKSDNSQLRKLAEEVIERLETAGQGDAGIVKQGSTSVVAGASNGWSGFSRGFVIGFPAGAIIAGAALWLVLRRRGQRRPK